VHKWPAFCFICLFLTAQAFSESTYYRRVESPTAVDVDRNRLIAAAKSAGQYLIRMQKHDGSFHYLYDAESDRVESRTYNIVRHAGTTLSLLDLYDATRDRKYLLSARRAIGFLKTRVRAASARASYVLDFDGKAKLGAAGLALAAITKQMRLDSGAADRELAARLANQIVAMQRKDGSFVMRHRLHESEEPAAESLYYPGEALLGLIRLYDLNHDRRLLKAVQHGATYLIDSQLRMSRLPPDAWLPQALEDLYDVAPVRRYLDHAIRLAEVMIEDQYDENDGAEYAGGFGPGPPRSTPAASRAEGLVSAYRLARKAGDPRASKIGDALRASAKFQLAQQFTAANSSALKNSRRALGGFRESLESSKIRIDFVQHNISSLLGIAETLY
jgi:hypothetical protein